MGGLMLNREETAVYAYLTDDTIQELVSTSTLYPTFSTANVLVGIGFTPGGTFIEIQKAGAYQFVVSTNLLRYNTSTGTRVPQMWFEADIGAGFVFVDSSTRLLQFDTTSDDDILITGVSIPLDVGDRVRAALRLVASNEVRMAPAPASADAPARPSIALNVARIGR